MLYLPDLWWFTMLSICYGTNGQIPVEKIQETCWKQLQPSVTLKRTYTDEIIWNKDIFIHRRDTTVLHVQYFKSRFYLTLQFLLLERPLHFSCDSVICFNCICIECNSHRASSLPAVKTEYKSLSRNLLCFWLILTRALRLYVMFQS